MTSARARSNRVNALTKRYYDAVDGMTAWKKVRAVVKKAIEANYADDDIARGLDQVAAEGRFTLTADSLRVAIQRTSNVRQLRPAVGGYEPFRNRPDYDADPDPWPQGGNR